jgi:hypothetical protein
MPEWNIEARCAPHPSYVYLLTEYDRLSVCYLTIQTNFMEEGLSWRTDGRWDRQKIARFLWNPNVHCRVHNSSPLMLFSCKNKVVKLLNVVINLKGVLYSTRVNAEYLKGMESPLRQCEEYVNSGTKLFSLVLEMKSIDSVGVVRLQWNGILSQMNDKQFCVTLLLFLPSHKLTYMYIRVAD